MAEEVVITGAQSALSGLELDRLANHPEAKRYSNFYILHWEDNGVGHDGPVTLAHDWRDIISVDIAPGETDGWGQFIAVASICVKRGVTAGAGGMAHTVSFGYWCNGTHFGTQVNVPVSDLRSSFGCLVKKLGSNQSFTFSFKGCPEFDASLKVELHDRIDCDILLIPVHIVSKDAFPITNQG